MLCNQISASKWQTYLQCSLKYHAIYELKIPDKIWPATIIGTVTHKVMELITTEKRVPDIAKICNNYHLKKSDVSTVKKYVIDTVKNNYFKDHQNIAGCEIRFKHTLKDKMTVISGVMDRVDIADKLVHVIDLKTGKEMYTSEEMVDNPQKKMYMVAARMSYPEYEKFKMTFWFVRQQEKLTADAVSNTIDNYETDIVQMAETIRNDNTMKPKFNKYCNICCYNDQCPLFKHGKFNG